MVVSSQNVVDVWVLESFVLAAGVAVAVLSVLFFVLFINQRAHYERRLADLSETYEAEIADLQKQIRTVTRYLDGTDPNWKGEAAQASAD